MLKGKTAVVTGGSRGIGKAIAVTLAKYGANVAIIYKGNASAAEETCKEIESLSVSAKAYCCDVADFEQSQAVCKDILADAGKIDILVNNAGIIRDNLILRMKEEDFDSVISTNLKGAFNMTKHLYQPFMRQRSGRILNITSVSGMMGNAGQANYSAAKAGLIGLTKTTAKELAGRGVTCNAIAPGFIRTDMTDALSENIQKSAVETIPLKRMGEVEEIAELAAFLASDKAGYITGEIIKIDGGLYI